ncbi:hypothetical protein HMF7854_06640 [Sphingomonas ginkgonis]|uniref:PilZ domain-containing protein n=1 Tax=Sphingomonas ginkgonis TaxID=2315330 RepID=A0A429V9F2_9SPHN|nr:PilZ domain-containing protein [Sphingomonas ginkgonis]RST30545.1 hypothetical protein HMF7854_06640 [Sphingomonas ginkgonis]
MTLIRKPRPEPRLKRVRLEMPGNIVRGDGTAYIATVRDLSSSGFRIETDARLEPGEYIDLQVGRERASAQIRWVMGFEAGGQFDKPVNLTD